MLGEIKKRNMLKRNSIVKFVFLVIIAVIGVLLCVCPFGIPASTDTYQGFVYSIDKGLDINGGACAIYSCSIDDPTKNIAEQIDFSLEKIQYLFQQEGYSEVITSRQGNNKVRIEVSNAKDTDYAFYYIDEAKAFFMTCEKAEDEVQPKAYVLSEHIKSMKMRYDYTEKAYGIDIEFTKVGLEKIEELKSYANTTSDKKVYIYLNEINASNLFASYDVDKVENKMFLMADSDSSFSTSTYTKIRELTYSIISGSLGYKISLENVSMISPKLGNNATLYISLIIAGVVLATFIGLWIRYKELGLLGVLSLIYYAVLYTFFLQAIPLITLNLAGIIGVFFGWAVAVLSNIVVFEKIRNEYAIGNKIHIACKGGFKKSLWTILDSHFILAIVFVVLWIFAPIEVKAFAACMLVATVLSLFCALVLTRYFVNIYLPINSTKAKRLGLKRDSNVKELKEEVEIIPEDEATKLGLGGGNNE